MATYQLGSLQSSGIVLQESFSEFGIYLKKYYKTGQDIDLWMPEKMFSIYESGLHDLIQQTLSDNNIACTIRCKDFTASDVNDTLMNTHYHVIVGGGSFLQVFASVIDRNNDNSLHFCLLPSTLHAMNELPFLLPKEIVPDFIYVNTEFLNTLPDPVYYAGFSSVLKNALIRNSNLFEQIMEYIYELCEKKLDYVMEILNRCYQLQCSTGTYQYPLHPSNSIFSFGYTMANAFYHHNQENLLYGECLSLGMTVQAYISYQRELINKDEFYEIRDMFVPFYLPISINNLDREMIIKYVMNDNEAVDMILLRKVGKATMGNSIRREEILTALNEICFDEAE